MFSSKKKNREVKLKKKSNGWLIVLAIFFIIGLCQPAEETNDAVSTSIQLEINKEIESVTESDGTEVSDISKENITGTTDSDEKENDRSEITEEGVDSDKPLLSATDSETQTAPTISEMQVHFIDVGQGDSTLVVCDGEAMLIDAGDNSKGTTVQLYLKKQGIKELKYLVLTHPDADHIGGADVIVTKFGIENLFMSYFTKDNKTYDELIRAIDDKGLKWTTPNVGNTYSLGGAEFTIIAPNATYSDPNNASIGLVLRNGEDSFLFTGDGEEEAEYDILANGLDISCDVYKAGHHGSKTASTRSFVEKTGASVAVISCAPDNSYGHPHAEPMNRFRSMGMKLFRTDEQGSIVATSTGNGITWNCSPSDSWQAGEASTTSTGKNNAGDKTAVPTKAPALESTPKPTQVPESTQEPEPTPVPEQTPPPATNTGSYAVNGNNGKIHIVGACPATGNGKNAMNNPVYFGSYEEAEAYSATIEGNPDKRKCKNCW